MILEQIFWRVSARSPFSWRELSDFFVSSIVSSRTEFSLVSRAQRWLTDVVPTASWSVVAAPSSPTWSLPEIRYSFLRFYFLIVSTWILSARSVWRPWSRSSLETMKILYWWGLGFVTNVTRLTDSRLICVRRESTETRRAYTRSKSGEGSRTKLVYESLSGLKSVRQHLMTFHDSCDDHRARNSRP